MVDDIARACVEHWYGCVFVCLCVHVCGDKKTPIISTNYECFRIRIASTNKNSDSFARCVLTVNLQWLQSLRWNFIYDMIVRTHTVDPIELQREKIHNEFCVFRCTRDRMHITNLSKWKLSQMLKRTHANTTCGVRPVCAFAVGPHSKTYLMPCETDCVTTDRPTMPLPLDTTKVGWLKLCDVMPMCFLFIIFFFHSSLSFSMLLFSFALRNSNKRRMKTICLATLPFLLFYRQAVCFVFLFYCCVKFSVAWNIN